MSADHEIIKNVFEEPRDGAVRERIEKKYLRYVQEFQGAAVEDAIIAFRTKDLAVIEPILKKLAESRNTASYLIGLGAVIIERENLYRQAGYSSYLEYARHLFEHLDIPVSTLSDDKIIMERYIDYHRNLVKAGFRLDGNANKLRYLEIALENHNQDDVFRRIVSDTFAPFRDWAKRPDHIRHNPEKVEIFDVRIEDGKLIIDGENILKFDEGVSESVKETVAGDLEKTFRIRSSGNSPFIVETYGRGEQRAIENFLKKYRAKK